MIEKLAPPPKKIKSYFCNFSHMLFAKKFPALLVPVAKTHNISMDIVAYRLNSLGVDTVKIFLSLDIVLMTWTPHVLGHLQGTFVLQSA